MHLQNQVSSTRNNLQLCCRRRRGKSMRSHRKEGKGSMYLNVVGGYSFGYSGGWLQNALSRTSSSHAWRFIVVRNNGTSPTTTTSNMDTPNNGTLDFCCLDGGHLVDRPGLEREGIMFLDNNYSNDKCCSFPSPGGSYLAANFV